MSKHTFISLLALASLLPSALSAPVLGREECICQPIDFVSSDNNSTIASCEAIARDIQKWRALAFHSPFLADVFVDAEEKLQTPRGNGHLEKRRFAHELHTIHRPRESLRSFSEYYRTTSINVIANNSCRSSRTQSTAPKQIDVPQQPRRDVHHTEGQVESRTSNHGPPSHRFSAHLALGGRGPQRPKSRPCRGEGLEAAILACLASI